MSGDATNSTEDCFLCVYDPQAPCDVQAVEGELAEMVVGARGQPSTITLEAPTGQRYHVWLQERDTKLLNDLQRLPRDVWRQLRLRVYHLKRIPSEPDGDTTPLRTCCSTSPISTTPNTACGNT
jgi:hypothetical protein